MKIVLTLFFSKWTVKIQKRVERKKNVTMSQNCIIIITLWHGHNIILGNNFMFEFTDKDTYVANTYIQNKLNT